MQFGFSYIGLIWLVMLFVPNAIWTKNQPEGYDKYASKENKILLILERIGQFTVTPVSVIFSDFNYKGWNFWLPVLGLSFLCMVLYDIAWVGYFRSEKTMKDFYRSFMGMPLCLATYPVIAFFLLGIYGGNIVMIIGAVILGIGHIGIHAQHAKEVFGPKAKKKLPVRIILGTLKAIGILLLVLVFGFLSFCIAGRNINQIRRDFELKDGVNEQLYLKLNDQEQYVSISGKDTSNPVIISLHGGPGAPTTIIDYSWQDYLTDSYTTVSWEERGCGRSYYHNCDSDPDNSTLSFEQQISDLDALVDYCLDRFGQDKVIILGHSYGSVLGTEYVMSHPEKVSAYIGVGQCVNMSGMYSEAYSYEDALEIAKERGDDTSAMEAAYQAFLDDASLVNIQNLRGLVSVYHPQTDTTDTSTMAFLTSPILGVDDIRWYILELSSLVGDSRYEDLEKPLNDQLWSFNIMESDSNYQVPVLFISGSCDWVCPAELVEQYADQRGLTYSPMEGCGHSPQGQYPERFAKLIDDFLIHLK